MRVLWLLATGILAIARPAAAASAPGRLGGIIERFDNLRVGPASVAVTNMAVTSDHIALILSSGRASPILAGDEIVGLFFEGAGSMEYTSVNPIEAPVVKLVSKKSSGLSSLESSEGVRLRGSFKRLLWLVAGGAVPEARGQPGPPLTETFADQRAKFQKVWSAPLSHFFAIQKLDAPDARYVWAEMDGGGDDLVYTRGGATNPYEALRVLRTIDYNDPEVRRYRSRVILSRQPLGRDPRDPPKPRFVLTDVDLQVRAAGGDDVELSVVETLVPMGRPESLFRFDLDSGVFATYGANLSVRHERLRRVTDEAGRSLPFSHEQDGLLVQLAEPADADRPVRLRFDIDGDFLVHPGGSSFWTLGVRPWFPQPELCEQYYTLHALVRVRKPYVPFAPGVTLRRAEEGGDNVLETRVEQPVQFAVVIAGDYSWNEEVRDGVKIRVATYALKNPRAMKQLTDLASTIIGFYTGFLGPFPFPEFNIVEIDDFGFGQAPPGFMFITKEAFSPLAGEANQLFSQGVNERFAHEIAHQYWGHAVKMPDHEESWLSESFAEYSAALFLKTARGESAYKSLIGHWKGEARPAIDVAPIPLAHRVRIPKDWTTEQAIRFGLLYAKGPLLLASLHRQLGDDGFLTFFKSYQKSFRWKFGSTKTVQGLLQFMTKKDFSLFFDQYYWGTALPRD